MSIKAKFRLSEKTHSSQYTAAPLESVKLHPVYGNGDPAHENTKYFNATPQGELTLGGMNVDVFKGIEPGDEVYIVITKVKKKGAPETEEGEPEETSHLPSDAVPE